MPANSLLLWKDDAQKKFHLAAADIKRLVQHNGGCIATDAITVDGRSVGYMYREPPSNDVDTGWRFTAGNESAEYMADESNHAAYRVNTIANYDKDILPFLEAPVGSTFQRNSETGDLEPIESPVNPDDRLHPEFPVAVGDFKLTSSLYVSLPLEFNRRIEDDSLVLWRAGVTLYFTSWNNDDNESIDNRLTKFKAEIPTGASESQEQTNGAVRQFSYRLFEEGINALYGLVVADDGHLHVAMYFDDESDIELARSILGSITQKTAS